MDTPEPKIPGRTTPTKFKLSQLEQEEQALLQAYISKCPHSFRTFYRGLVIASMRGPKIFQNCIESFQRQMFEELTTSIEQLRDGKMPDHPRVWMERTKKASKDADLAIIIAWLAAFPVRPFYIQVGAGNREQANIVRERISHLMHHNPWLNNYIELVNGQIRSVKKMHDGNPMCRGDVLAADAEGSHGGTPDLMLINELTHIVKFGFAETMMDNADGVVQGMAIVATNAGFKGTKQEVWRNNAMTSERWKVYVLDKPAPWHTAEMIEDAKKRNVWSRFLRLWRGRWVSGKGDAVQEEKIEKCFTMDGPDLKPLDGYDYVIGVDLSVKKDYSAISVTGVSFQQRRVRVAYWRKWIPDPATKEINLIEICEEVYKLARIFRVFRVLCDPYQAAIMMQILRRKGVICVEMSFSVPKNLVEMGTAFVQLVEGEQLDIYDDDDTTVRRDFGKFNIVEKNYGQRLEAVSDEHGHADVGTAIVITLPFCMDALKGLQNYEVPDEMISGDAPELSEDEVEEMPAELREIYELEGGGRNGNKSTSDVRTHALPQDEEDQDFLEELSELY